jgi:hypothetical protein
VPASLEVTVRLVLAAAAALLACTASAAALPAVTGPPGAQLRLAPQALVPGPANGDLALGLEGWTVQGREAPLLLAPGARLRANTTLVSPPLALPPGAQTLTIRGRAPSAAALLEVRARPEQGGAEVELGVLEPGARTRAMAVGLGGLDGTTVRIVLDPVPGLGASFDVLRVGPVTAPLPGWTAARGAIEVSGRGRTRALRVDERLELRSPRFRTGPGARELLVAVRGDGMVRARAGGRWVAARAGSAWRDVRVPLRRGRAAVALSLSVRPGPGGIALRDLGIVRRATRVTGVSVRRGGGRVLVRGRLVPAGGRLAVEVRDARGRRLASRRADAAGRVDLAGPAGAGPLTLVVPGDRTRIGLRARL